MECKTLPTQGQDITHFDRLLLTANRRLANYHQQRFNAEQIKQGKSSWKNPDIAPLKTWLTTLWQDHCQSSQLLLSPLQEQEVWQGIIEKLEPELLDIKSSALLAKSAYETLKLWNCSLNEIAEDNNEQVGQFYQWALAFEKICKNNQWCNFGQIISELQDNISEIAHPKEIYLDGFDDLPPAYKNICAKLRCTRLTKTSEPALTLPSSTLGVESLHMANSEGSLLICKDSAPKIQKFLLADTETELWTMARFAKSQVEKNPDINFGCIIPNLAQIRNRVEYIFTKVFSENILVSRTETRHFFNLSAGSHLISHDIIRVAKASLNLIEGECELEELGHLLQSPYLCMSESDASLGAQYHAALLNLGAEALPLNELFTPLSQFFEHYSKSTWLARLKKFLDHAKDLSPRSPHEWAIFFNEALETLAWPGQRSLDSQDYQLCARFHKSLDEFSALDLIYSTLSFKKARQIFNDLLSTTIFQAQSLPAPVQILGTLESAGFHFDSIWIMGMHDEAWPQPAKPHPFLPREFQIKNNMPHASPIRELRYAKQVLERLLESAPNIILSSPLRDGDKILQPSELINFVILSEAKDLLALTPFPAVEILRFAQDDKIEFIEDNLAPPISQEENIRGGSWIIKQQAICPFRAFASVRLKAKALPEPSLGLSPSERGILLHRCLEKVWTTLRDQSTLLSMSENQIKEMIGKITNTVIQNFENKNAKPQEKFLKTEKKRLEKLLVQWLEFEKNREPFSIAATESQFKVRIGELDLQVQVDRIDQLENGQYLIIDYKTGSCSINDWLGPRPQDPQLPLYCSFTHMDQEYSGISFAEIKPGKLQFKGIIEGEEESQELLPGVINTPSWGTYLHQWRNSIQSLSAEFSAGQASVSPFDHQSCEYCDLQSLCRVNS